MAAAADAVEAEMAVTTTQVEAGAKATASVDDGGGGADFVPDWQTSLPGDSGVGSVLKYKKKWVLVARDQKDATLTVTSFKRCPSDKMAAEAAILGGKLTKDKELARIPWSDMYGVSGVNKDPGVDFKIYTAKPVKSMKRKLIEYTFTCPEPAEVEVWVTKIGKQLSPTHRKILVLLNPFSGTKKALKVFNTTVKKMFDVAPNFGYDLVETTHAGHATEHVLGLADCSVYSAICTISGDGMLMEALNGMMNRPDWQEAAQIPLGEEKRRI